MLEFIDPYEHNSKEDLGVPGRRWRASEIRLKSHSDLQKLWVVLMKERNMLHTARHMHKKRGTDMPYPERIQKVQKSMAVIKRVLAERENRRKLRKKLITLYQHNNPTFNTKGWSQDAAGLWGQAESKATEEQSGATSTQ
uniref:Large ribosomal subunit protein uL29m n=1 Tax=Prymnesium polylepis TaxID=72548 RepID=A0A7S4I8K1_9EUKA